MLARRDGREAVQLAVGGRGVRPRQVDPNIHSAEEWCAWARGPKGERSEGRGTSPHDALQALTVHLKGLSR